MTEFISTARLAIAGRMVVASLISAMALGALATQAHSAARTVAVEAVTLRPASLVETVSSIGSLVADESVVIRPEVDGRIVEIAFDEGQPVKAGQLLFRLDDAVYRAQLDEAEARQELTQRTYERAKTLRKKGAGSGENLDKALSELRIAEASVELNKARLEKTRIVAPFAGTMGLRKVSLGAFVEAKNELVTLVNLDSLKVEFRVPERYYRVVSEGGLIRAAPDALPGEVFEGRIYAIAPVVDINGRSVAVKARVGNPKRRLRPGMFVRITMIVGERVDALVVPESAILQRGDGQFVYRIDDGKAALIKVRLGLRQTGRVEVVDGLRAGDTVVTAGQIKLRPGTPVKVVGGPSPGTAKK